MSKDFLDFLKGKGTVSKRLIDKTTGKVVWEDVDHNLIVKVGRNRLIKALAGEKLDVAIKKMGIGKGGTKDLTENAFNPIKPVDSDAALKQSISVINLSSAVSDINGTNPKATFIALFDCDKVDSLVNECALFFEDGTSMFARHTFDTVSLKSTSNFSLQITWSIEF